MKLSEVLSFRRNHPSLNEAVKTYISACHAEGKTERTLQAYSETLNQLLDVAKSAGFPTRLSGFRSEHVYAFMDATRMRGVSSGTQHRRFRETRAFFSWCERMAYTLEHPFKGISNVRTGTKVIKPFTKSDIDKLLKCCDPATEYGLRFRAIILLLLDTGMRRAELEGLDIDDVDLDLGRAFIRHGKGRKQRVVPFSAEPARIIGEYINRYRTETSGPLFLRIDRGSGRSPFNKYHLGTLFQRLGSEAGVHANPHRFRHTFATWAIQAGAREIDVQYLLGHSTAVMTRRYAATYDSTMAAERHQHFSPVGHLQDAVLS
jgi:site-specific recombinase XerD